MGFYDKEIKRVCESCPRLLIMMINSIFNRNHPEDAVVEYLDKEQAIDDTENLTYLDSLVMIENSKYHIEYQMVEGNMAIRMVEYGFKETIRDSRHNGELTKQNNQYKITITMPMQAVVFLAGANKSNQIDVELYLPDGKYVSYSLPCVSASQTIKELIDKKMYILIPFQQAQLNDKMNKISSTTKEYKLKIAEQLLSYHKNVKNELDKLLSSDILTLAEINILKETFTNIERYLSDKDEDVKMEVDRMGDNDYIPWSDRIREEGRNEGRNEGAQEILLSLIKKKLAKEKSIPEIADELEETEEAITKLITDNKLL